MTIVPVQGKIVTQFGSTYTVSLAASPANHNLVILSVGVAASNATIATPSGYSLQNQSDLSAGATKMKTFWKVAGASESPTISATLSFSASYSIIVSEYSGMSLSTVNDRTAQTVDSGATVTSRSSGTTASTTAINELLWATVITDGNKGSNVGWTNSFTPGQSGKFMVVGTRIVSTSATYETTASWTTARKAAGAIGTYIGA